MLRGTFNNSDPDIVYYNGTIINDQGAGNNNFLNDPVVRFSETRSNSIISDISQYYFSIVRFTINGPNKDLPLLIPDIQIGQPDINLTSYSVNLQLTKQILIGGNPFTFTGNARRYIEYETETIAFNSNTSGLPLPFPPLTTQDYKNVYYYVYTYSHFVNLVNTAIQNALSDTLPATPGTYHPTLSLQSQFNAFWTANGGVGAAPSIITEAPYLKYDQNTTLFSLYGDSYGCGGPDSISYNTGAAGNEESLNLWFNTNLFGLLANFDNQFLGNETSGLVNNILFYNKFGTNIYQKQLTTPGAAPVYENTKTYFVMYQDYNSTSTLWSPIESIVFTTSLIPIIPESSGEPVIYGSGNDSVSNASTNAFTPIITDIALPLNNAHGYREFIEYAPVAEYRLSSLTNSRQDLRNIDIQVFFKARLTGELIPLRMFNLSSVGIKIMFRKKGMGI
jgi:hypothetical protein